VQSWRGPAGVDDTPVVAFQPKTGEGYSSQQALTLTLYNSSAGDAGLLPETG